MSVDDLVLTRQDVFWTFTICTEFRDGCPSRGKSAVNPDIFDYYMLSYPTPTQAKLVHRKPSMKPFGALRVQRNQIFSINANRSNRSVLHRSGTFAVDHVSVHTIDLEPSPRPEPFGVTKTQCCPPPSARTPNPSVLREPFGFAPHRRGRCGTTPNRPVFPPSLPPRTVRDCAALKKSQ